jgi:polysaccharide export outer membrane protein
MIRTTCLAAVLLVLGGCGGTPPIAQSPAVERAAGDQLPLPAGVGPGAGYVYRLGALDSISIEVDGLPDLRREVVVDGQGMISYPLAGSVPAAGLTGTELADVLEQRLRAAYVRDPKVSVNVVEAVSNVLTVDGQIRRPGLYPVYRDMSLMQAVALAGGENDYARTSVVLVFREVSDRQYVGLYDLRAIRLGNYADPSVYPGDKIVISEDETRRLLASLQGVTGLLTTPLVLLLR